MQVVADGSDGTGSLMNQAADKQAEDNVMQCWR